MPKPDLYLFVSKFRTTFAKHKEKGRSYEQKSQGIIWTKSIAAI
jgi:hypothetical protein